MIKMYFPAFKCNDSESFKKICAALQQIGTPNQEHIEIRKVDGYYQPSLIAKPRFIRWIISRIFGKPEHQRLHTVTDFVVRFFETNKAYANNSDDAIKTIEKIRDRIRNLHANHKLDTLASQLSHPDLLVLPPGTHKLITLRHDQQSADFSFVCKDNKRVFAHQHVLKQADYFNQFFTWQQRTLLQYDEKEKSVKMKAGAAVPKLHSMDLSIFPKSTVDIFLDILYDNKTEVTMPYEDFTWLKKLADYLSLDSLTTLLTIHEKKRQPIGTIPLTIPETLTLRTHTHAEEEVLLTQKDIKDNASRPVEALSELMLQGRMEISLENLLKLHRLTESRGLKHICEHIEEHLTRKILDDPEVLVDALFIFYKEIKPNRDRNHFDRLEDFLNWKPCIFLDNICSLQKREQLFQLFLRGAEKRDPVMQDYVGLLFLYGFGTERNYNKCVDWFRESAKQGYALAQHHLGHCYEFGYGVVKDLTEALKLYQTSYNHGIRLAHHALGRFYQDGIRVTKDIQKAITHFRAGMKKGCAYSTVRLANCYRDGKGVPKNDNKAFALCQKAASKHWWGKLVLADCYENGYGVEKNPSKAFQIRTEVAKFATAQNRIGRSYLYGIGTPRDEAEAMRWYRKAAENGDSSAQYFLGRCYFYSYHGYNQDYAEAYKWLYKAAEQNYSAAQSAIAFMYYWGNHVGRDYQQALMWILKAEESSYLNFNVTDEEKNVLKSNFDLITNHPY